MGVKDPDFILNVHFSTAFSNSAEEVVSLTCFSYAKTAQGVQVLIVYFLICTVS